MKSILPRILILAIFASTGVLMHAQGNTTAAPVEFLRPMKNSFSIGVRMIGGAKVTFGGNLGATDAANWGTASERHAYLKSIGSNPYNDGSVGSDGEGDTAEGRRPADNSTNTLVSDIAGRFLTILYNDANDSWETTGDYLSASDDYTRNWSFAGASQLRESNPGSEIYDQVAMSTYASLGTEGRTVTASNSRRPGIELVMGRVIQRYKRFEWGFTVGFGFAEFNAKTRQSVPVRLQYVRDIYNIYSTGEDFDQTPTPGPLGDPSTTSYPTFNSTGEGAGKLIYKNGAEDDPETEDVNESESFGTRETTNPISATPVDTMEGEDAVGAPTGTANGYWQVKGVYYVLRVGPMARIPIGRRFSAYLSAGYMAGYIGSKFRYEETVTLPNGTGTISTKQYDANTGALIDTKENQQYLGGCYADFNFEWWLTTRTGFYAGASYERLNSYTQAFHGRNASVKMDNGLGLRFGIITRF